MNQITTIKIERIDSALALIAAKLKPFIMNSNFDGWKLTTSACQSNLYFPLTLQLLVVCANIQYVIRVKTNKANWYILSDFNRREEYFF